MLVSAVAAGVLTGVATGGSLDNLSALRIRLLPVFLAALALRLLAAAPVDQGPRQLFHFASLILLSAVALFNLRHAGSLFVAIGLILNTFAIVQGGGAMPILPEAAQLNPQALSDGLHAVSKNAYPLGDVIPLGFFGFYSVGDVAIALGTFTLITMQMRTPK